MPVHPNLLEIIENSKDNKTEYMSIDEIRQSAYDAMKLVSDPEEIYNIETKELVNDDVEFLVRVYRPSSEENLPVILYFHPGGYVKGNIDTHDLVFKQVCLETNCVVVGVNYRKGPENKFPEALEDAYFSLCWIVENAEELKIDSSKIVVMGESSGGNLAAALSIMARDRKGPHIGFQVLVYPQLDFTHSLESHRKFAEGYVLREEALKFYVKQYVSEDIDKKNPYLSPYFCKNLSNLPPAFIISAEYDILRDEAEQYAEKLKHAHNKAYLKRYKGMIHGFFQMDSIVDDATVALKEISGAIKVVFHEQKKKRSA